MQVKRGTRGFMGSDEQTNDLQIWLQMAGRVLGIIITPRFVEKVVNSPVFMITSLTVHLFSVLTACKRRLFAGA